MIAVAISPEACSAVPDVRLRGCSVLVTADNRSAALRVAAVLSQSGAAVTVAQGLGDAKAKLERDAFDTVMVLGEAAVAEATAAFIVELRAAASPAFAVVVAEKPDDTLVGACLCAGALEILESPDAASLVDAAAQCVRATWRLRSGLRKSTATPKAPIRLVRQAPHTPAVAPAKERPTSKDGVEQAIESLGASIQLSPRERAVLRLMALGYRYQDIGDVLRISERTVKMHAANLRKKTNVSTRYELLQRMYQG